MKNGEVTTSSPGPTLAALTARCNPVVPEETATPYAASTARAKSCSKRGTRGPSDR